jgi:hypothetical protein
VGMHVINPSSFTLISFSEIVIYKHICMAYMYRATRFDEHVVFFISIHEVSYAFRCGYIDNNDVIL